MKIVSKLKKLACLKSQAIKNIILIEYNKAKLDRN